MSEIRVRSRVSLAVHYSGDMPVPAHPAKWHLYHWQTTYRLQPVDQAIRPWLNDRKFTFRSFKLGAVKVGASEILTITNRCIAQGLLATNLPIHGHQRHDAGFGLGTALRRWDCSCIEACRRRRRGLSHLAPIRATVPVLQAREDRLHKRLAACARRTGTECGLGTKTYP